MNKSIEIIFSAEKSVINPDELSMFLLLFGSAYRASAEVLQGVDEVRFVANQRIYVEQIVNHMVNSPAPDIYNISSSIPNYEISGLSYSSPLSVWSKGTITALVAAVIISGGKAELWGANFELNSLGTGIANIMAAFERESGDDRTAPQPNDNLTGNEGDTDLKRQ